MRSVMRHSLFLNGQTSARIFRMQGLLVKRLKTSNRFMNQYASEPPRACGRPLMKVMRVAPKDREELERALLDAPGLVVVDFTANW